MITTALLSSLLKGPKVTIFYWEIVDNDKPIRFGHWRMFIITNAFHFCTSYFFITVSPQKGNVRVLLACHACVMYPVLSVSVTTRAFDNFTTFVWTRGSVRTFLAHCMSQKFHPRKVLYRAILLLNSKRSAKIKGIRVDKFKAINYLT